MSESAPAAPGHAAEEEARRSGTPRGLGPWAAMLGAPVVWFVHQQLAYSLVQIACERGTTLPLHAAAVVALLCVVANALYAEAMRRSAAPAEGEDMAGSPGRRARFMASVGVALCGIFFLLIFAQELANILQDPCAY